MVGTILLTLLLTVPAGVLAQPQGGQTLKLEAGEFDCSRWDHILQNFVTYESVNWEDWHALDAGETKIFLQEASAFRLRSIMGKEPKVAFLMNVYTAFAVSQILDNYPVTTLEDIEGFFDTNTIPIDGREHTLNSLAETVRTVGRHFPQCAVAMASGDKGHAPLAPRAYTSANLLDQATQVGRAFLTEQIEVDGQAKSVTLPALIGEHIAYFENQGQGLVGGLSRMVNTSALVVLTAPKEIKYRDRDLSLRITPPTSESKQ